MIRTVIKYTDNKILLNDAEVFETSKELFSGMYDLELDKYQDFANFIALKEPNVFDLMPSNELINVEEYINKFLSDEYYNICKKSNILIKSGILLYGKQGIGKSNYINWLIKKVIKEKKACVFNINSYLKLHRVIPKIKELRQLQNNLFVIVLEEMDEIISKDGAESVLKNFMDGIDSIENCLFIASTNYIELIPKSLTERPSRFKKVLEIKQSENTELVKKWLEKTYNCFIDDLTEKDYEHLHEKCLNKTIDEIKHILIDYKMEITTLQKPRKLGFGQKN